MTTPILTTPPAGYLTVREAAARLEVQRNRVHELCRANRLHHVAVAMPGQPRPMLYIDPASVTAYATTDRRPGVKRKNN